MIIIVIASFILGAALGVWAADAYLRKSFYGYRIDEEYYQARLLDGLSRALRFDERQRVITAGILIEAAEEYRTLLSDFKRAIKALRVKNSEKIKSILSEDQLIIYNSLNFTL